MIHWHRQKHLLPYLYSQLSLPHLGEKTLDFAMIKQYLLHTKLHSTLQ